MLRESRAYGLDSLFCGNFFVMPDADMTLLSETEKQLKERFASGDGGPRRLPSTATPAKENARLNELVLPDDQRPKMPFTKDKYLIKENPHKVQWEREVRKFLRKLSPDHGHRVTAVMVYEWATGLRVADLMTAEPKGSPGGGPTWRTDLRIIHRALEYYFGKPGPTWIMGRKVDKAYTVKPGYFIRRHRPQCLTLYAEYVEGVLNP